MKKQQRSSHWNISKPMRPLTASQIVNRAISSISSLDPANEVQRDDMKAERLTRKTNFKRHQSLPVAEKTAYYDLTAVTEAENWTTLPLSALAPETEADIDDVKTLPLSFQNETDVLTWCGYIIAESPTARKLAGKAAENGWRVGLADLHSGGFYLDVSGKTILIDHFSMSPGSLGRSIYFRNAIVTILIRALRDVWHEDNGAAFEDIYTPEDVLMIERVRAADCDTVSILSGWELRGAGFTEVWRHLIGAEEGDMALIFTQFLERDPTALFDGSALAYAFRQWFADDSRVNGCDHDTLELLDDMLLDETDPKPLGTENLKPRMIENLSALPDGIVYLAGLGETIHGDSFFAGLHDPINKSHLLQLVYDLEVTMVNNVPFRDKKLAHMIFPQD